VVEGDFCFRLATLFYLSVESLKLWLAQQFDILSAKTSCYLPLPRGRMNTKGIGFLSPDHAAILFDRAELLRLSSGCPVKTRVAKQRP